MDNPIYRVNLRNIMPRNEQAARRHIHELRAAPDSGDGVPDLEDKIDMIYRVAFATRGVPHLTEMRQWIEAKFDRPHWQQPLIEALAYSGDVQGQKAEAARQLDDDPDDPMRHAAHIRALLLAGEVAEATAACKAHLTEERTATGRFPRASVFMVQHLLSAGEGEWLRENRPAAAATGWQFRYLRRLRRRMRPRVRTFCINMDRDEARLRRAEALIGPGVDFRRSPAVSGVAVPEFLLAQAGMEVTVPRKAQVGCHLSHMRAWERVVQEVPEGEYGLVVEDDAVFTCGPGVGLFEAIGCARAGALDLLFINTEASLFVERPRSVADIAAVSVDQAMQAGHDKVFPGWGGEGYLLTPAGAAQLIAFSKRFGIIAPLDWQIALYATRDISPARMRSPRYGDGPERIAAARAAEPGSYLIAGGVLNLGLITQSDLGYKTHVVEVSVDPGT